MFILENNKIFPYYDSSLCPIKFLLLVQIQTQIYNCSSIHGILQARILEWVAISFSRESYQPRDRIQASHIEGRCFNLWATRETH